MVAEPFRYFVSAASQLLAAYRLVRLAEGKHREKAKERVALARYSVRYQSLSWYCKGRGARVAAPALTLHPAAATLFPLPQLWRVSPLPIATYGLREGRAFPPRKGYEYSCPHHFRELAIGRQWQSTVSHSPPESGIPGHAEPIIIRNNCTADWCIMYTDVEIRLSFD